MSATLATNLAIGAALICNEMTPSTALEGWPACPHLELCGVQSPADSRMCFNHTVKQNELQSGEHRSEDLTLPPSPCVERLSYPSTKTITTNVFPMLAPATDPDSILLKSHPYRHLTQLCLS